MNTNTEMKLYPKQQEAVDSVMSGEPTSVVSHISGAGKTTIIAPQVARKFFQRYPKGNLVIVGGHYTSTNDVLLPVIKSAILKDTSLIKQNPSHYRTAQGGVIVAFSTNKPELAGGYYPTINYNTDPVMVIIDDAEAVTDETFQSLNRCTIKYSLCMSSGAARWRINNVIELYKEDLKHPTENVVGMIKLEEAFTRGSIERKRANIQLNRVYLIEGMPVLIEEGYYLSPNSGRVSNFWSGRRVNEDGSLGDEWKGYGGNFPEIKADVHKMVSFT